ncbi:MAG: hypothetical protein QM773_05505 [Hyphomonadaceae bacterium]
MIEYKFSEMNPEAHSGPTTITASTIRAYAEQFGERLGFVPNKHLPNYFSRPMCRHLEKSNISGFFQVNPDTRRGPRATGLSFFVHRPVDGLDVVPISLESLLWGAKYYDQINGQRRAVIFDEERSEALFSASAKWGVQAQLTLFNTFLDTLDEPTFLGRPLRAH